MTTAQPAGAAPSEPHTVDERTFVIVGAGLAGAKGAEALRGKGFTGRIVLVGDETERPYERPPLSKGYLNGTDERDSVFVHPENWYPRNHVDLRLRTSVVEIDRDAQQVLLAGGESIRYDGLLLTTGSRPRPFPGLAPDVAGVHYLRRLGDSDALRDVLSAAERVVVVGAGWIGLEITAAARTAGVAVTVVESADLPLLAVLGPEVAKVFADLHVDHGVDLRLGAQISEIVVTDGRATGVRLVDGSELTGDAVIIGIGAVPNIELAESAGLAVDNGILVDARLQTSDPKIFAAGDVANAEHPLLGRRIRVEHWANALGQPAVAAGAMVGGTDVYRDLPYFYTDQYDLGMEYSGYVQRDGYDQVVFRGDVGKREFIAFWLSNGKVLAGMNVNVWDVTDAIKELITGGQEIDPARLEDMAVPLDQVAGRSAASGD